MTSVFRHFVGCLLVMWLCSHVSHASFKTSRPWCFNGHIHYHPEEDFKDYLGVAPSANITAELINRKINDTFHRMSCDLLEGPEDNDCCSVLTADNIFEVLDIPSGSSLSAENYEKSSTIILTWAFQLQHKCNHSDHIDWSSVTYHDIVHELLHSFHDDHEHESHEDEHDDASYHDDSDDPVDKDDDHHDDEFFTAVSLEKLMRTIDVNYRPGDMVHDGHLNKTEVCSSPEAWHIMSREIWKDLHIHDPHHGISEDEISEMSAVLILHLLHGYCIKKDRIVEDNLPLEEDFIKELVLHFGNTSTCTIDEHGFDEILHTLGIGDDDHDDHDDHDHDDHVHAADSGNHGNGRDHHEDDDHDHDHEGPYGAPLSERCLDSHELQETFHVDLHDTDLNREKLLAMCPALLQQAAQGCQASHDHSASQSNDAEKWGYATLSVLIISILSLLGLVVTQWRHTAAYKYLLTIMLGLAAGSLIGDTLLHLVPHALELHDHDHNHAHDISQLTVEPYVWKMLCACASVWAFFLLQLGLSEANEYYVNKKRVNDVVMEVNGSFKATQNGKVNEAFEADDTTGTQKVQNGSADPQVKGENHTTSQVKPVSDVELSIGSSTDLKAKTPQEVAWMAVVGDAVHNLADGLAIGASYSADPALGLSTALAVLCHEIPHEFGDIAIMLSAGWTVRKVAALQLISASAAFIGVFIGVPLATGDEARHWIFVIAAGMFLYVALANVLPELIQQYQSHRNRCVLLAGNIGFVLGVVLMLLIAIFEEYIAV